MTFFNTGVSKRGTAKLHKLPENGTVHQLRIRPVVSKEHPLTSYQSI